MADTITTDLGPVTAYADAVKHGYTGTREDFGKLLAGAGQNLADAAAAKDAAEAAADNAGSAAQTATDAAGTAGQAAGAATNAAGAASTSAGAASTSAGAAAQSAEAAETAQQSAENAAKKAVEAKTGAENALKDADTAKDAASGYADAATESATAAAASATNAAGSAKSASNAAQKIEDSAAKIEENEKAVSHLKEEKLNKPALPVVGELLRVKSVSDAGEVEVETEDISELQKRQNVLVGSESGNPVSCDDAFAAPLFWLHIYGKSTQDGTPTPDAPVPIVSAGDGGTIAVTLSDGNGKTQTLTLPTPTGLPGIPVTSGGNYTDSSGQQWVCDEVDLERGMKVQRVKSRRILSDEIKDTLLGKNSCYIVDQSIALPASNSTVAHIICTHIAPSTWSKVVDAGVQGICMISNAFYIGISMQGFKSVNEYKDFFANNKVGVTYELATPIETTLTADEIAAYKALTTYAPNTVVQASDGAGVKLDYQRDVNLVIKNLEDAIASMTTT